MNNSNLSCLQYLYPLFHACASACRQPARKTAIYYTLSPAILFTISVTISDMTRISYLIPGAGMQLHGSSMVGQSIGSLSLNRDSPDGPNAYSSTHALAGEHFVFMRVDAVARRLVLVRTIQCHKHPSLRNFFKSEIEKTTPDI
jgi:hypothetical protein